MGLGIAHVKKSGAAQGDPGLGPWQIVFWIYIDSAIRVYCKAWVSKYCAVRNCYTNFVIWAGSKIKFLYIWKVVCHPTNMLLEIVDGDCVVRNTWISGNYKRDVI